MRVRDGGEAAHGGGCPGPPTAWMAAAVLWAASSTASAEPPTGGRPGNKPPPVTPQAEPRISLSKEQLAAARKAHASPVIRVDLGKGVRMPMVIIPAGGFLMGSPPNERGRDDSEGPPHRVVISRPFYMGVTEVTQAQWRAVMATAPWKGKKFARSHPQHPANYVSLAAARAFVRRLNRRLGVELFALPTEAQWEYACRAGTRTRFYYGDDPGYRKLRFHAWYSANTWNVGERYPHHVARSDPTAGASTTCTETCGNGWPTPTTGTTTRSVPWWTLRTRKGRLTASTGADR